MHIFLIMNKCKIFHIPNNLTSDLWPPWVLDSLVNWFGIWIVRNPKPWPPISHTREYLYIIFHVLGNDHVVRVCVEVLHNKASHAWLWSVVGEETTGWRGIARGLVRERETEEKLGAACKRRIEYKWLQLYIIKYLFKVNAAIKVKQANWGNGDGPTGRVINLLRPSPIC